jgi:hypothetical protein
MTTLTDAEIDAAEKRFVGHGDSLAQSTFRQVFAQAKRANALAAEAERLRDHNKSWQLLAEQNSAIAKDAIKQKESAERRCDAAVVALKWLDASGGLGLDKHARIREALKECGK